MRGDVRLPLEWNFPLSGNVSQNFGLPFSSGATFGLFNINMGSSGDTALEQEMLVKVGSYGRQLGRICDVVEVILAKMGTNEPVDPADPAVVVFKQMAEAIKHAKTSQNRA